MRLLNTRTYKLESFAHWARVPPYAILSHAWGDDEVLYADIDPSPAQLELQELHTKVEALLSKQPYRAPPQHHASDAPQDIYAGFPHLRNVVKKKGWAKIEGCCREAEKYGIRYVWVDTICIDKSVSDFPGAVRIIWMLTTLKSSAELSEAINSMWAWVGDTKMTQFRPLAKIMTVSRRQDLLCIL